jgi:hypothetical protein
MGLRLRPLLVAALLVIIGAAPCGVVAQQQPAGEFDFGRVLRGTAVEHEFVIENNGAQPVHLTQARMTPPLTATALPGTIAPGKSGTLRLRLDTARLQGLFEGTIALAETPTAAPASILQVRGFIVPPIELIPGPALFLSATRGESSRQSIELVNHEATPLAITDVVHTSDHFTTRIDAIEAGRRFRLTLQSKPDAPAGRHSDRIILKTSSPTTPTLAVQANTLIHDRVYTFPDSVDMGALPLTQVRANPAMLKTLAQRLMVYSAGATDFAVRATTDVPGLRLSAERSAAGDRWQITATLNADVSAGPIAGQITIETNDREFPRIAVPVTGSILP